MCGPQGPQRHLKCSEIPVQENSALAREVEHYEGEDFAFTPRLRHWSWQSMAMAPKPEHRSKFCRRWYGEHQGVRPARIVGSSFRVCSQEVGLGGFALAASPEVVDLLFMFAEGTRWFAHPRRDLRNPTWCSGQASITSPGSHMLSSGSRAAPARTRGARSTCAQPRLRPCSHRRFSPRLRPTRRRLCHPRWFHRPRLRQCGDTFDEMD